ncbi:MAG TPA: hypothetical protein VKG63_10960 [Steroidobacteraceae bacterium]|nr:hypothetical protein [Steroidobacteraceae bacterium]
MQTETGSTPEKAGLPLILFAAVVQGWSLYGLHLAIKNHHWPATDQPWLIALYALAVFVPLTLQLLARHARNPALWGLGALLAAAYFYFGWHYGGSVSSGGAEPLRGADQHVSLAFLLTVLWLLALPFAQGRLAAGRWTVEYGSLFADAWRNKLMLAEAALFTGIFWLLLFLWQMLFHMLGIDYFRELFEEPVFIYPVTSLTFGCALHLIGSIERLTSVVLEQLLNVLKWLGLLAGVILALFTVALVFKLPGLVFTGHKAIGAAWLLWLTAVMVLLLNAAYRDGSVPMPYPKWIAQFLRFVVPLTVIVSLTALYALATRAQHYGLTVGRVWAFVVAGAALLYSAGYSAAAFRRGPWLGGIARVNVLAALALIAVIAAALTPLLSPYRLAADSQFKMVMAKGLEAADEQRNTALHYLRFDSGRYGRAKLEELTQLHAGPNAADIRRRAEDMLAQTSSWAASRVVVDIPAMLAKLRIFPVGRMLDRDLIDKLTADLGKPGNVFDYDRWSNAAVGIYVDLNGDGLEEFVFLTSIRGVVYENRAGSWKLVGYTQSRPVDPRPMTDFDTAIAGELAKGNMSAIRPKWNELSIGGRVFVVNPRD